MGLIELEKQDHLQTAIKAHKRTLLVADQHATSLDRKPTATVEPPYPIEGVDCTADLDSPCDCPSCEKSAQESMAYAMADYKPPCPNCNKRICECRPDDEHPEDELCDNALCGCHDDCDRRDCETCFDHAIDRAERMAEGDER